MKKSIVSLRAIFMFLSVLFTVGCSNERNFRDDSFKESILLSGEARNVGVEFMANEVWAVGDSLVVVNNVGVLDSMIILLNSSDWGVNSIVCSRAEGFVKPSIVKNNDVVMLYDLPQNKLTTISEDRLFSTLFVGVEEFDIPKDLSYLNNTFYYQDSPQQAAGRIVKLEARERSIFHDFTPQLQATKTPFGYYGSMAVNPNGERLVYAYRYLRRFDIFKSNGKVVSVNIDPSAAPIARRSNGVVDRPNSTIYYDGVSVSSESIYLFYIGYSAKEIDGSSKLVTFVESFDWDGKPLVRYQLDGFYSAITYTNGSFVAVLPERGSSVVIFDID